MAIRWPTAVKTKMPSAAPDLEGGGGFLRAGEDGFAFAPVGLDERRFFAAGKAALVAIELGGDHVDGGGGHQLVVLVVAAEVGAVGLPIERRDGDILGDAHAGIAQPRDDIGADGDDGLGALATLPGEETGAR